VDLENQKNQKLDEVAEKKGIGPNLKMRTIQSPKGKKSKGEDKPNDTGKLVASDIDFNLH
jgi:hypothetical protein